ncbi:tRNA-guanine transglycosylase DpdA [Bosea sp. BIWAKO-01]|uniref:tRNA-guanine transglycosylase DpdA n=1 Tax=Bosea sp. BIWAKO-01 TaxID=506668 RepID=UPI0008537D20|nr:tRNA-guanine transglycosylase DpdA [Bosea sp. BIWAKO-01]GAU81829.1 archaeosine tRNA-ribosyltransferase [Bosea sp. BIWAKO-01]
MKFLYSDSLDFVDPLFDFVKDQRSSTRRVHHDDLFPHEFLDTPPYDGLLVSRAIVGDVKRVGKYNDSQAMRFRREGARSFLRFPESQYPGSMLMGDNGAFTYRNEAVPPHTVENTLEFYHDAGFTHGCSIDHLIFDFQADGLPPSDEAQRRYDITLSYAEKFLPASRPLGPNFTPVGVIQGWSAASMATSAAALVKIGFSYLAVGGMVPLQIDQIRQALQAIREAIPSSVQLHLLGFGKTEELQSVRAFGVSSFDTTSPLLRAFKDGKRNYYSLNSDGSLDYYTAVRIPQALDNDKLMRRAKRGHLDQESLLRLERDALETVRASAARKDTVEAAVQAVLTYGRYALWDDKASDARNEAKLATLETAYTRTLGDRPWERCDCRVCREAGVDALIFRSSNRNKRRGMHNLHVFHRHLKTSEPVALEETV